MKFLSSLKSAMSFALVAATLATAIGASVAPSPAQETGQFSQGVKLPVSKPPSVPSNPRVPILPRSKPDRVIVADGRPQLAIFDKESISLSIGCMKVRNLWSGIRTTEKVSPQEYQRNINATRLAHLHCGAPNLVQGYTSPAFFDPVIVARGIPFYVSTSEFFHAMGITPTNLSQEQGTKFLQQHRQLTKTVLDTRR